MSHDTRLVNIDHPVPQISTHVADLPAEPVTPEHELQTIPLPVYHKVADMSRDEYSSPAFIKRARVSYGSLFEGEFGLLEDDGGVKGKGRKRTRFSTGDRAWRYSSQSPSPEREEHPAQEDALMTDTDAPSQPLAAPLAAPLATPLAAPLPMVDEGCQTVELDVSLEPPVAYSAPSIASQPDHLASSPINDGTKDAALEASTSSPPRVSSPLSSLPKSGDSFGFSLFGTYIPNTTAFTAPVFPTVSGDVNFDADQVRFGFVGTQIALGFSASEISQVPQPELDSEEHYPETYLDRPVPTPQLSLPVDTYVSTHTSPPDGSDYRAEEQPRVNGAALQEQVTVWPITAEALDAKHAEGHLPLEVALAAGAGSPEKGSNTRSALPREADDYGHNHRRYQNEAEKRMVGMKDQPHRDGHASEYESDEEAEYEAEEAGQAGDDYDMTTYADVDDDEGDFEGLRDPAAEEFDEAEIFEGDDAEESYNEFEYEDDESEYDEEDDQLDAAPRPDPVRREHPIIIDLLSDSEEENERPSSPPRAAPSNTARRSPSIQGHGVGRGQPSVPPPPSSGQTQIADLGTLPSPSRIDVNHVGDEIEGSPSYDIMPSESELEEEDEKAEEESGLAHMLDIPEISEEESEESEESEADEAEHDIETLPRAIQDTEDATGIEDKSVGHNAPNLAEVEGSSADLASGEAQQSSDVGELVRQTSPPVSARLEQPAEPGDHQMTGLADDPGSPGPLIETIDEGARQAAPADSQQGNSVLQDSSADSRLKQGFQVSPSHRQAAPTSPPLTQPIFDSQVFPEEQSIPTSPWLDPRFSQPSSTNQLPTPFDTQVDGYLVSQQTSFADAEQAEQAEQAGYRISQSSTHSDLGSPPRQSAGNIDEADAMEMEAESTRPLSRGKTIDSHREFPSEVLSPPAKINEVQEVASPGVMDTPVPVVPTEDSTMHGIEVEEEKATAPRSLSPPSPLSAKQTSSPVEASKQECTAASEVSTHEGEHSAQSSQVSVQESQRDDGTAAKAITVKHGRSRKKRDTIPAKSATGLQPKPSPTMDPSVESTPRRSRRQPKPTAHKRSDGHQSPAPEGQDISYRLAIAALEAPAKPGKASESALSLKMELTRSLRPELPECLPLQSLSYHIGKKPDVVAIATTASSPAERTKTRQFVLSVNLTDPTIAPSKVVEVQFYRAHKDSLPDIQPGDGVLLRNFEILALSHRGFGLRSQEDSSYAVFGQKEDKPQIKGPPMEDLEAGARYVARLKQWYGMLDSAVKNRLSQANQKMADAISKKR